MHLYPLSPISHPLTPPHLAFRAQGLLSVLSPDDRRVVAMERHADADLNVRGVRLTFHWRPEMADDDVQSLYNAWSLVSAASRVAVGLGPAAPANAAFALAPLLPISHLSRLLRLHSCRNRSSPARLYTRRALGHSSGARAWKTLPLMLPPS